MGAPYHIASTSTKNWMGSSTGWHPKKDPCGAWMHAKRAHAFSSFFHVQAVNMVSGTRFFFGATYCMFLEICSKLSEDAPNLQLPESETRSVGSFENALPT